MNLVKRNFVIAFKMLRDPWKTFGEVGSETSLHSLQFLLIVGAVTALLTPLQIYLGFEDVNGLHAGGQAEFLAKDLSAMFELGVEWRPLLIEMFYIFVLLFYYRVPSHNSQIRWRKGLNKGYVKDDSLR